MGASANSSLDDTDKTMGGKNESSVLAIGTWRKVPPTYKHHPCSPRMEKICRLPWEYTRRLLGVDTVFCHSVRTIIDFHY